MDKICTSLAEYYFLDSDSSAQDLEDLVQLVNNFPLTRAQVERIMIEEVAPVAGANLGFLIFPTIGEWSGFDKSNLEKEISTYKDTRAKRFSWVNWLQDRQTKWMLKKLNFRELLDRLEK